MTPLNTFCLAAVVFLSLPLPMFASAAVGACPSARPLLMRWVCGNAFCGSVAGVFLIATPLAPWYGLIFAAAAFLVCGTGMIRNLAVWRNDSFAE